MLLTDEQQRILNGEFGEVQQRLMRLLVRLGEIYAAEKMVAVNSVQIAGVSYKSLGDPGLEFLEDLANKGTKARVLATLNPAGIDLENWQELGFPQDFAEKQHRVMNAFAKMGMVVSATCTPYLAGNLPRFAEHIAWAESSAVSFANSVIGARTNREGGPSALAAAILGFTPLYGLHLEQKRKPQVKIQVNSELNMNSDFGALGHHVGKLVKNKIPYFTGIADADTDNLKALGAAMAASGAVALYHIENITPEAHLYDTSALEQILVSRKEIDAVYQALDSGEEPELAVVGCPHASIREIRHIAQLVEGIKLNKPLWICTSRLMKENADRMGLTKTLEDAGAKIVADTCMVVSPLERMKYKSTGVNSGKAACYLPGFCKQKIRFQSIEKLIEGCRK